MWLCVQIDHESNKGTGSPLGSKSYRPLMEVRAPRRQASCRVGTDASRTRFRPRGPAAGAERFQLD